MRLFFRGQCPVWTLFRNQFYRGWIIFSGEWRGITFWVTAFEKILNGDSFPWGLFTLGLLYTKENFPGGQQFTLKFPGGNFSRGSFPGGMLLWEIFLFSCSQLNELKIKSETLLCSFIYWINVSPEFFRVNVLCYKKAMVLSQIVFTLATWKWDFRSYFKASVFTRREVFFWVLFTKTDYLLAASVKQVPKSRRNHLGHHFVISASHFAIQCVKSVRMRCYSATHFPHSDLILFSPNAGKWGPE